MNEIRIYGEIGSEVTSAQVIAELDTFGDVEEIPVRINSNGGSVSQGVAIANAFRKHPAKIHTIIEGGAHSIAGYIACCGDRRTIEPNSLLHIHGPQLSTTGNLKDHEDSVAELARHSSNMADHYAAISNLSKEEIEEGFSRDLFYDAEEAVEAGYMTNIGESEGAFAMRNFRDTPGIPRRFSAAWLEVEPTKEKENMATKTPATIKEMEASFKGASAEFLVKQVKAEADMAGATAAYIEELEGANATLATANTKMMEEMEAMDGEKETPEETIARLTAELAEAKAMDPAEMDDDDDDDDDAMAMDDEETEAMDDDESEANILEDEVDINDNPIAMVNALRKEVRMLRQQVASKGGRKRSTAKAKRRGKGRMGARAIRTSNLPSQAATKKSATAELDREVKKRMDANAKLGRSTAVRQVFRDHPKLAQRVQAESQKKR